MHRYFTLLLSFLVVVGLLLIPVISNAVPGNGNGSGNAGANGNHYGWDNGNRGGGGHHGNGVPEIDTSLAHTAIALLSGGLLILKSGFKKK
jgi:hypothetical protein